MRILKQLRQDEGLVLMPYRCPRGFWTIGYGHKIDDLLALILIHNCAAPTITESQAQDLLLADYSRAERDVDVVVGAVPMSEARRDALVMMAFNLGQPTFVGFRRMLSAVRREDWAEASREALDSRWRSQVGERAVRIAKMLETGEWPENASE